MELIVEGLEKRFDENEVLKGVNARFQQGKIYALLGRNGSGKTTFFNCVSGEMVADSGIVVFADGSKPKPQDFGYVYATPMLPEFLTGYEFITFFIDIHKHLGLKREDIDQYFEQIQFSEQDRHKLIKEYSLGMRNKLQLISILMLKPKILFLDEPLTSFDVVASVEMKRMLVGLKHDCIMILATHITQIARDICDEVLILHHGITKILDSEVLHDANFEDELIRMLSDEQE